MANEKPLYDDKFLKIGTWLNSGTVTLILGTVISIVVGSAVHWLLGAAIFAVVATYAIASFIILKK